MKIKNIFKGGYLVEVVSHDGKKVILEVVDDHVVKQPTDNEIGLQGFDFNYFDEYEKGVGRGGSSEFPYLLMLINLWPGDWKTWLKRINQNLDKENGKSLGIRNGRYQKFRQFSSNEFWKNIGCLV